MSKLVKRVDLDEGLPDIYIPDDASGVVVLVIYHGTPLGEVSFDRAGGLVSSRELANAISEKFYRRITHLWFLQHTQQRIMRRSADMPSISIVVPTCDRPEDLERCLKSLSQAKYRRKAVIVVDNGSNAADTRAVAVRYGARYVREPRRGLDFARNAGILASTSDIVAFADDDVVVDRMWLASMAEAFRKDSGVACVTGLTMPVELETDAQELFEQYCDGGFRRGYYRMILHRYNLAPASAGKAGAGANMAIRRSVLGKIGLFDNALDCGTPAKAGGDTDMFYRILRHGFKICYEPRVLSWHRHRKSMEELERQLAGYSTAVYAYLTKCLLVYRDMQALCTGAAWFKNHHLRNLLLCIKGKPPVPARIVLSEFLGVFRGPLAYFKSNAYARRESARFDVRENESLPAERPLRGRLIGLIVTRFAGSIRR